MVRVDFDEVFRDADGLLPLAGKEQRVGQSAVRGYGIRVMRRGLPQIFARSAVVFHLEENKAAQMARLLVAGADVQYVVDEFKSLVQPVLGQVEPRCGKQRSRLVGGKPNQLPRAGFGILKAAHGDRRIDDLFEAVPVIGLHVEYGLSLLDRLLELLEL